LTDRYPGTFIEISGNPDPKEVIFDNIVHWLNQYHYLGGVRDIIRNFMLLDNSIHNAMQLHAIGVSLQEMDKLEESTYCFAQSILMNPSYHQSYQRIGDNYRKAKNHAESIALYKKAIDIVTNQSLYPDQFNVTNIESYIGEYYFCIGLSHGDKGDYLIATNFFRMAKDLNNNGYFGYIDSGYNNWDQAINNMKELAAEFERLEKFSDEDYEDIINKMENQIRNHIPTNSVLFEKNSLIIQLTHTVSFFKNLSDQSKNFYVTAEMHFYTTPEDYDFSTVLMSYCKVLENELRSKYLTPSIEWIKKKRLTTKININIRLCH